MIKFEIVLDEDDIKEIFENNEIRYSKKKAKELQSLLEEVDHDIIDRLKETAAEIIGELTVEEWG